MTTGHCVSLFAALAEPDVRGLGREPHLREEHLIMINRPSLFTLAFLPAVAFALTASAADTVTALKVPNAPDLAAGAADPTWAKAQALSVPLAGGTNLKDGKTTATI